MSDQVTREYRDGIWFCTNTDGDSVVGPNFDPVTGHRLEADGTVTPMVPRAALVELVALWRRDAVVVGGVGDMNRWVRDVVNSYATELEKTISHAQEQAGGSAVVRDGGEL